MVTIEDNGNEKLELKVLCKLPGHDPLLVSTETFRLINQTRDLDFILYKTSVGKLQNCGIVEDKIMERVWPVADKVFRRTTREGEKTVSFRTLNSTVVWSFFAQVLKEGGYVKPYSGMDAHHCSGNRYDQRIGNGLILPISVHRAFHRLAKVSAEQGYEPFIASLETLGDPNILAHYANDQGRVLFRNEDDNQMQEDVILDFFGSIDRYDRCCKTLLERTEGQTEKEIQFDITL